MSTPIFRVYETPEDTQIQWARQLNHIMANLNSSGGYIEISKPTFYTPTLVNSWVNFATGYSSCQYCKDGFGIVHLKGMIASGTMSVTAFVLPVGYRPAEHMYFGTSSAGAFGSLAVYSDGSVVPDKGSNIWFSLDGVTFAAA